MAEDHLVEMYPRDKSGERWIGKILPDATGDVVAVRIIEAPMPSLIGQVRYLREDQMRKIKRRNNE